MSDTEAKFYAHGIFAIESRFFFLPLNQMTETFNTASGHLAILSSSEDNIRQFLRYFTTFFVVTVFSLRI